MEMCQLSIVKIYFMKEFVSFVNQISQQKDILQLQKITSTNGNTFVPALTTFNVNCRQICQMVCMLYPSRGSSEPICSLNLKFFDK